MTVSVSVMVRGGVEGALLEEEEEVLLKKLGKEKLSSVKLVLSRRNAAAARRFPVWRRAMASSMSPKWQQACPRTKYLCQVAKTPSTFLFSWKLGKGKQSKLADNASKSGYEKGLNANQIISQFQTCLAGYDKLEVKAVIKSIINGIQCFQSPKPKILF